MLIRARSLAPILFILFVLAAGTLVNVRIAGDHLSIEHQPPCDMLVIKEVGKDEVLWQEPCTTGSDARAAHVFIPNLLGTRETLEFSLMSMINDAETSTYKGKLALKHPLAVDVPENVHAGEKLPVAVTNAEDIDATSLLVSFTYTITTRLGTKVATRTVGCGPDHGCLTTKLPIAEATTPGPYRIVVESFHGNTRVAVWTREIAVIGPKVPVSPLCANRHFTAAGLDIPCIADGERCEPTDVDYPYCMCFRGAEPGGICYHGQRCSNGVCLTEPGRDQPYIVTRTHDSCYLRLGDKEIGCVDSGQVCFFKECGCLHEGALVATCRLAQLCQADGCVRPTMLAHLTKIGDVEDGIVTFGVVVNPPQLVPRKDDFTVTLGGVPASAIEHKRNGVEHKITTAFDVNSLTPGYEKLKVVIDYADEVLALTTQVSVPFPEQYRKLDVAFLDDKRQVSEKAIRNGATLTLPFTIDYQGSDEAVTEVRRSEMQLNFTVNGKTRIAPIAGLELGEDGRRGVLRALLQHDDAPLGQHKLTFSIDSLGRRGTSILPVLVLTSIPLAMEIVGVDPPRVFQLQLVHGFDLDVYVTVEADGTEGLNERSVVPEITAGPRTVKGNVASMLSTPRGVLIRTSFATGCQDGALPAVPTSAILQLRKGTTVLAQSPVSLVQNPGGWEEGCSRG